MRFPTIGTFLPSPGGLFAGMARRECIVNAAAVIMIMNYQGDLPLEINMNKKYFVLGVCLLLVATVVSAQVPSGVELSPDIGVAAIVDLPGGGDYDLFDLGLTAEVQFRDWASFPWGYALTLGYGEWSVDRNASSPGAALYDFSGNLEVVPFGGSLLYSVYDDGSWRFLLDAGVRYSAVDSQIKARNRDEGGRTKYEVDIDDSIQYLIGASADYTISPDVSCSFGAGYRDDISRGELSTERGPGREAIMESFFLSAALRFNL